MSVHLHIAPAQTQRGAALVTSLIILIVLAMIGTSAIATGFVQLRMSGNSQEQAIAAAGAQSAINTALRIAMTGDDAAAVRRGHLLVDSRQNNLDGDPTAIADADAALLCLNQDQSGTRVAAAGCTAATQRLVAGANNLLVRARSRMFYRGKLGGMPGCPGNSSNSTMTCGHYEVEGQAWIDGNGNGQMDTNQGETTVIQRHFAWSEVSSAGI